MSYPVKPGMLAKGHSAQDVAERTFRAKLYELPVIKKYISPAVNLLDFGCGSGELLSLLQQAGYHNIQGFDPSPESISAAREYFGLGGLVTDFLDFRFQEPVGAIVCMQVLQYVPDIERTMDDLVGILRPGGILLISYANPKSLYGLWAPRLRSELYNIPIRDGLKLIAIEPGHSFLKLSDSHWKRLFKLALNLVENTCWIFGLKYTDALISVYKKK